MIRFTLTVAAICIAVALVIDILLIPLESWMRASALFSYKARMVANVLVNGAGWLASMALSALIVGRAIDHLPHLKDINLSIHHKWGVWAMLVPYMLFLVGSTFATMFFATLLYQGRWLDWFGPMKWVVVLALLWGVGLNATVRWQTARRNHRHEEAVRLRANRP